MSELDSQGREIFDQTPLNLPFKFDKPIPLHIRLKQQVRMALALQREEQEIGSFEEEDDFTPDDGPDPFANSPYEVDFDHVHIDPNELDPKKLSESSKEESAEGGSSGGDSQKENPET